jgi:uncharacterized membrane protein (DUF485 family)
MKKHYNFAIMMTSFFLIFFFFFTGIWAFTGNIGDGSWNETIFFGSYIGSIVAIVTFIISLIWTIFRGWK